MKIRIIVDPQKLVRKVEEKKAPTLPKHEPGEPQKN
jgi:hypothetical protein